MHRLLGTLVLQRLPTKLLPEPDLSQKMSGLLRPNVVAGYGVVPGFRRSAEERVRRDYDPARDGGGTGGDVAREVVARNLHATRAQKRDADPREIPVELRGSTRARVVLDRVAFHLEVAHGLRRKASKNMPAQLSWIVFPTTEPPWASVT